MSQRVSALFALRQDAERAVGALLDHGVDRDEISLVARGAEHVDGEEPVQESPITVTTPGDAAAGAGVGAGIGALLGLAGMMLLVLPGVGPIAAAGTIGAALATGTGVGAAAGAVAGGVYGALRDVGIDEAPARAYESGILAGATLVSVRTSELTTTEIEAIFRKYNASEITSGLLPDPDPDHVGILT